MRSILQAKPTMKSARARSDSARPAKHTLAEILSQPHIWRETERHLRASRVLEHLAETFSPRSPWLFVGCGSSYYLSRLIAALWTKHFYIPATGVPASELLFAPEETMRRIGAEQIVLMSRSGETTEVLRTAELLEAHKTVQTLAVTCHNKSLLEKLCTHTFKLNWADEKSTVMTRSFTAILLAFQRLALQFIGDELLSAALDQLPKKGQAWLDAHSEKIQEFGRKRKFRDFVFLGQGVHYWLAQEAALKVTEMSSSYAQAYHSLEFRLGPRGRSGNGAGSGAERTRRGNLRGGEPGDAGFEEAQRSSNRTGPRWAGICPPHGRRYPRTPSGDGRWLAQGT